MFFRFALHLAMTCLLSLAALPAVAEEPPATTHVVVLGVNHAMQLVSSEPDQPASELTPRQARPLDAYWARDIVVER